MNVRTFTAGFPIYLLFIEHRSMLARLCLYDFSIFEEQFGGQMRQRARATYCFASYLYMFYCVFHTGAECRLCNLRDWIF